MDEPIRACPARVAGTDVHVVQPASGSLGAQSLDRPFVAHTALPEAPGRNRQGAGVPARYLSGGRAWLDGDRRLDIVGELREIGHEVAVDGHPSL